MEKLIWEIKGVKLCTIGLILPPRYLDSGIAQRLRGVNKTLNVFLSGFEHSLPIFGILRAAMEAEMRRWLCKAWEAAALEGQVAGGGKLT